MGETWCVKMMFNDRGESLEIIFESFDSLEERRFMRTAFELIKSQAHFNKALLELSRNVIFKNPE